MFEIIIKFAVFVLQNKIYAKNSPVYKELPFNISHRADATAVYWVSSFILMLWDVFNGHGNSEMTFFSSFSTSKDVASCVSVGRMSSRRISITCLSDLFWETPPNSLTLFEFLFALTFSSFT